MSGYLTNPTSFETAINRGVFSYRSKRLDAVVAAIANYHRLPSQEDLDVLETRWAAWKEKDPKEFANRGAGLEADLKEEIRLLRGPQIPFPIVDPNSHPVYEPLIWNTPNVQSSTNVQTSTNCYAYACNDRWGHLKGSKSQPGQAANQPLQKTEYQAHRVRLAVQRDTDYLHRLRLQHLTEIDVANEPTGRVVNVPGYYLVALVVAQNQDYHWLRQDRTGYWSHKPGHGKATDLDSSAQRILNPMDCNLRYFLDNVWVDYRPVCFYRAPQMGVRTGNLADKDAIRYFNPNP